MNILGISRGTIYSPNLASSDAAIFHAVAQKLRARGHQVECITEDEMLNHDHSSFQRIYTMARDTATIKKLQRNGHSILRSPILNSLSGIITCTSKGSVASLMLKSHIPQPDFIYGNSSSVITSSKKMTDFSFPLWVKNSVSSAITASDTVYCTTKAELDLSLEDFRQRHIDEWLVQEHVTGDLIKFYGVEGTDFFHWYYASQGHSKFGLESINGKEKGYTFDPLAIKEAVDRFARHIDVPIYGGDAVIDSKGQFRIIDFNDFPSFSVCRDKAAEAIAERVIN